MGQRVDALRELSSYPVPSSKYWSIKSAQEAALRCIAEGDCVVLYGPPGTGKTKLALDLIHELETRMKVVHELVQFHPKFGYEDFMEGYRPDGKGGFTLVDGVFKTFCSKASADKDALYVFLIDEFNRAELSTTLGEVLLLIEDRNQRMAKTAHSGSSIQLPPNLIILGTMNTADKTIAIMDYALRRRFKFIPVWPDYEVMKNWLTRVGFVDLGISIEEYCRAAFALNKRITSNPLMNKHMQIGHAMFVPKKRGTITRSDVGDVFRYTILPQLETYCGFGREDELKKILNANICEKMKNGQEILDDDIFGLIKTLSSDQASDGIF